ncbi:MAG: type I DNA topoisomerase [Bacteroidales bacterium]|nr:type I DNA topoisomerase [Bacteroidales bacterium]
MKNLVIVESPAKAKTIEKFLGKDYTVKSSYGHIRDLAKKEMSIDVAHGYEPQYQISEEKRSLVSELKKAVSGAEQVWLASDEDREGEAIAWHLQETLKLDPARTHRIVFNEITRTAILHAIEHPRQIDMNLVDAQQARRVLDRLVGYEISPILWSKIKPALSAGRVQSVAVRLVVDREEEIRQFESVAYFRVVADFHPLEGGKAIHAELSRHFSTEAEAQGFLEYIAEASFGVSKIETRPTRRSPAPPFTTSTLQQEASRKLGFSVARTMQVAQQLYESGYITYMRTDSVNLSDLALGMARKEIASLYGEAYVKTRRYQTRTKGAQEAHEAIRPTNLAVQSINAEASQRRLYELIWKRTVASQMADAEMEKTEIKIDFTPTPPVSASSPFAGMHFGCTGEQVKFDGFLKVYIEGSDDEGEDESERLLPRMPEGTLLALDRCEAAEHYTQHPPRYTEASLVKKMEELGIGRPSTYAPTISTILKREYIIKEDREAPSRQCTQLLLQEGKISRTTKQEKGHSEKGKLVPTDIGRVVNDFLMAHFTDIMDYNFTATVEKDFDEIADGKKEWRTVIEQFYVPFHRNIELTQQTSHRTTGSRLLGVDPKSGKNVYAKIGRYGTLVQIGDTNSDEKPLFASMKKNQSIETITLDEALALFALPRNVGTFEGEEVLVSVGKFGPYVRHAGKFYSLGKNDDPYEIALDRAIDIITTKRAAEAKKEEMKKVFPREVGEYEGAPVTANIGKYGPYLTYRGENFRVPKGTDPLTLSIDQASSLIKTTAQKNKKKK